MNKKDILDAWAWIRSNNSNDNIPDDVLDLMKNAAIEKLTTPAPSEDVEELSKDYADFLKIRAEVEKNCAIHNAKTNGYSSEDMNTIAKQSFEAGKATVSGKEVDTEPKEEDYTYGARDASGEVYDQVALQFYEDLEAWKKRNTKDAVYFGEFLLNGDYVNKFENGIGVWACHTGDRKTTTELYQIFKTKKLSPATVSNGDADSQSYPRWVKELKEIREAFQWTWDNIGNEHTADMFNIPANGMAALDRLIEETPSSIQKQK